MQLTWQVNDEWWGKHAIARHEDYKVSVMFMRDAGNSVWRIDEDYRAVEKGVCPGSVEQAQAVATKKLRRLKIRDRFNRLFRRK
jgi:hypothetical protein